MKLHINGQVVSKKAERGLCLQKGPKCSQYHKKYSNKHRNRRWNDGARSTRLWCRSESLSQQIVVAARDHPVPERLRRCGNCTFHATQLNSHRAHLKLDARHWTKTSYDVTEKPSTIKTRDVVLQIHYYRAFLNTSCHSSP
jgi:hypothetical protein